MNKPLSAHHVVTTGRFAEGIDIREVQDFFWRRWKHILCIAAVVVALTTLVLMTLSPRYTATAQVFLQPRKEKILGAEQIVAELNLENSNVDSQLSVIQSINLLRRVVEREKLVDDPEFVEERGLLSFVSNVWNSFGQQEAVPTNGETSDGDQNYVPQNVLNVIKKLRDAMNVERVNRTYVLSISVSSKDPGKAVRLANAVANAFVVDQVDARYEAAKHASAWLSERIEELRLQVRASEENVAKFRRENNLIATSSEGKTTITDQQLSELNEKLISARADVAEKRAKYEQAKSVVENGGDIQGIPDVVRSEAISSLRVQQAEVARKEADLAARYGARNPTLINARAERRNIDRSIESEVRRILLNLKNDFEISQAREKSLEASLDHATGKTGLDNNVGVRLRELERVNEANKTIFENFLARAKITQEQSSLEESEARLISPATKPSQPSFPKKGLTLAIASVFGIILGIASGMALDSLNPGYMTASEIETKLGYPVLASVPLLGEKELRINDAIVDPSVYLERKPLSRYSEAVRAVRVGIRIADVDSPPKVVLVTSSVASEGKSTLIRSLAVSAAKGGQKVLLIDCDLRHPSTTKFFQAEKQNGLVEVLTGMVNFEEAACTRNGFTLLPAGLKSQNPPDLLGSERMKHLLAELRSSFDLILIDSPPVEPVIDAKVLRKITDKVVFVVRWQRTERETVARNVDDFAGAKVLAGIVLNIVDETKTPRYGAYASYSGYYHSKYYQN
jgi:succinoglycan biosynthesis transport protein ExoP